MQEGQADLEKTGYNRFMNSADKKGYSGTLIYAKKESEVLHFRLFFCKIQSKNKFGSDALGTDNIDVGAVCLDDLFHDGKSKPGAFFVFSAGGVRFVETIPDQLNFILWNPYSSVLDRNK